MSNKFAGILSQIYAQGHMLYPRIRSFIEDEGLYGPSLPTQALGSYSRWKLDHIPYLFSHSEFHPLREGIMQRTHLFELLLHDIYTERKILQAGIIPPEIIFGHAGYLPLAENSVMRTHKLLLTAMNLIPQSQDEFLVWSDSTANPPLLGYTLAAREISHKAMPEIYQDFHPVAEHKFLSQLQLALTDFSPVWHEKSDRQHIALFSPGIHGPYASDDWLIASRIGIPLVQAEDLNMQSGKIVMNSLGEKITVDVLWHKLNPAYLDPLDLRSDSQLGIPGLVETVLRGKIGLANHFGAAVLMNPALLFFWDKISRFYLQEEPLLHNVPSFWAGISQHNSHIQSFLTQEKKLCEIVNFNTNDRFVPQFMSQAEKEILSAQISNSPWAFAASEWIEPQAYPSLTSGTAGYKHSLQSVGLRVFGLIESEHIHTFPGGLGTVFNPPTQQGLWQVNRYKDIWVEALPERLPVRNIALRSSAHDYSLLAQQGQNTPPRVLNNMFWFGRYIERIDFMVRSIMHIIELSLRLDDDTMAVKLLNYLYRTINFPYDTSSAFTSALRTIIYDETIVGSIKYNIQQFVFSSREAWNQLSYSAAIVITRMSDALDQTKLTGEDLDNTSEFPYLTDQLSTLMDNQLDENLATLEELSQIYNPNLGDMHASLTKILTEVLAINGIMAESLVRDSAWIILEIGYRCERVLGISSLIRHYAFSILEDTNGGNFAPDSFFNDVNLVDSLSTAILRICDSLITARNRSHLGSSLVIMSQVAILDKTNPRSLSFNLQEILGLLHKLPDLLKSATSVRIAETMLEKLNNIIGTDFSAREIAELTKDIYDQCTVLANHFETHKLAYMTTTRAFGAFNVN